MNRLGLPVSSGLINLDGQPHYLHWGFVQISWANLIVILSMIVIFILALVIPFHGRGKR